MITITELPSTVTYQVSFTNVEAELVLWGDYQNENGLREWLQWDSEISDNVVDSEQSLVQNSFSITLDEDNYDLLKKLIDEFMANAVIAKDL